MDKTMNNRQAICLLSIFLFGNSALFGINSPAGRDSWLSLLLATVFTLLIVVVYARIYELNASHGFFEALTILFGKWIGRILAVLMIWYALHLNALLMRSLTEFGKSTSISNPPYYSILLLFTFTGIYLLHSGENLLGRWSFIIFVIIFLLNAFTIIASIKDIQLQNLLPILRTTPRNFLSGTSQYLSFPFMECIVFLPLLFEGKRYNAKKIYILGVLIAAAMLLSVILCNFLLLGEPMLSELYFPTHIASKLISVGEFIERIEELVSVFMLLTGVTKYAVCLFAAAKGLAYLCGSENASDLVGPAGVVSLSFSLIIVNNMMELDRFLNVYPIYALPFQVLLPIIIWMKSEYRQRILKRTGSSRSKQTSTG